ncbi:GPI anchored serine-threonine rich family protein [Gordonia sputi]|uniref:GPI anchored serine-threonine rich family protein n=1 Tax=Gordonia sputi TaxID=36823 RepID=UPI0020439D5A|nr:GPI anchored serine-threonine rich family protein [Gordonia sputi]MCM3898072.1 GPI anchored serine-threonine rich family protein [Gordonia sputi]
MDSEPLTLSDIGTSRALRTDDELLRLVAAIHGSRLEAQETNWLEWKSSLDLNAAAGKFAVAKAVLGFANRSVEDARLNCGGVAYLVVGVEPGTVAGIPAIDHADLTPGIKTYAATPRFTPRTIRFSGVEVLVVVVEPPEPGDSTHTLQKQYDKFHAGLVFHRGTARTAPAGPIEMEMLGRRLVAGAQRQELDLELTADAEPLMRLRIEREELEDWLRRHEAYVRANSGKPADRPPPRPKPHPNPARPAWAAYDTFSSLGDITGSLGMLRYADPKDAEEFDRRVADYLAKLRSRLMDHVLRQIVDDDDANTVRFRVVNDTDDAVSDVQLMVRIRKSGALVRTYPPSVRDLPALPKWPDPLDKMLANAHAGLARAKIPDFFPHAGSVVDTGDAFEVTWDVGDLRPRERSGDFTLTIVAGTEAPEEVSVEMVASAMDRRGIRTKTVEVTVGAETWTIDDFYNAEPED